MPAAPRPSMGIVGAGTMGTGIAGVAALAGCPVIIQDVAATVLDRSRQRMAEGLARRVARGRLQDSDAAEALARIIWTTSLEDLKASAVVIEAAPEDLALKREIFRRLDEICADATILASNTSSLPISAMGAATRRPERVIGMHFFNPVSAMALVEVIRGARTSEATVEATLELARDLGKTPVRVAEAPGFLVNRVTRPFSGEALRVLAERKATAEVIDWIMREAGGYRIGPFELIDLVGVDVSLAVSRAVYEAFFHDPRCRPHPLQQQMVDAGLLGRKSGRGFYEYDSEGRRSGVGGETTVLKDPSGRPQTPPLRGSVAVVGAGRLASELAALLRAGGLRVLTRPGAGVWKVAVAIDAGLEPVEQKARACLGRPY